MGPQRHGWFPAGLGAMGLAISQELRVTCHLAFFYDEVLATGAPCCQHCLQRRAEDTHRRYLLVEALHSDACGLGAAWSVKGARWTADMMAM